MNPTKFRRGKAPGLPRYASQERPVQLRKKTAVERFYGKRNDRMAAFGETSRLSARKLDLLIRWLRGA